MVEYEEVKSENIKSYLKGRSLSCAFHLCEIIPRDYEDLISTILDMCADFVVNEKLISIKLVGIKTLIKYARKLKDQTLLLPRLIKMQDEISMLLLRNDNFDYIYLPIEAISKISKLDEA